MNELPSAAGQPHEELSLIRHNHLAEIAHQAELAIVELWDESRSCFWRNTEQRARDAETRDRLDFFPTATLRCLASLLRVTSEHAGWLQTSTEHQLFKVYIPALLERSVDDLKQSTLYTEEQEDINPYTLALYLQAISYAYLNRKHLDERCSEVIQEKVGDAMSRLLASPSLPHDVRRLEEVHPFVRYHVVRAIHLFSRNFEPRDDAIPLQEFLSSSLRTSIETLLAKSRLGLITPGESVALAFCSAGLALTAPVTEHRYIRASLDVCFEAQEASGCWPLGRVVRENKDLSGSRLEISTYEVAWAVAESERSLFRIDVEDGSDLSRPQPMDHLLRAGDYARVSIVHCPDAGAPAHGWCSDHPFGKPIIESWTSATVLEFAASCSDLIDQANRRTVMRTFTTRDPRDRDWPNWLRWQSYMTDSEVDYEHPVLQYLDTNLIQPILSTSNQLPSADSRTVSVLLFGPPGTSKTTIVQAVADGLKWPVIFLSPGNFIESGLEFIEAQARKVFDRLQQLSRVVVIFDECDELFRERKPLIESEQVRGITAFVTASMLPKLQDLHDRGRVVFFICTNNFDTIDPAIKRGGRIDHILGIGPPDIQAREQIIRNELSKHASTQYIDDVVNAFASSTERFIRSEIIRATRSLSVLAKANPWSTKRAAISGARRVAEELRESLTISQSEFDKYRELQKAHSHAYKTGGA